MFHHRNSLLAPVSARNGCLIAPCSQLHSTRTELVRCGQVRSQFWVWMVGLSPTSDREFSLFSDSNLLSGWLSYVRTDYRDSLSNESHPSKKAMPQPSLWSSVFPPRAENPSKEKQISVGTLQFIPSNWHMDIVALNFWLRPQHQDTSECCIDSGAIASILDFFS